MKSKLFVESNINAVLRQRGYRDVSVIYTDFEDLQTLVKAPRQRSGKADAAAVFAQRYGILPHVYLWITYRDRHVIYPPPNYYPVLPSAVAIVFRIDCGADLAKCQEAYETFKMAYGLPPDPVAEAVLEIPQIPPEPRVREEAEEREEKKERREEAAQIAELIPRDVLEDIVQIMAKEDGLRKLRVAIDEIVTGAKDPFKRKLEKLPEHVIDFVVEEIALVEKLATLKRDKPKLFEQVVEAIMAL